MTVLVFSVLASLSAQNNTYDLRSDFFSAGNSSTIVNETFTDFTHGQQVTSLFSGIATFEGSSPTIFSGGWQHNCLGNEFMGKALIPEPRFQGNSLVMNFDPPIFGVGASAYDDHDGTPLVNEIKLELITTKGDTLSINETCSELGDVGFLGGTSTDHIVQAIWSIDNNNGNLEIDSLAICKTGGDMGKGNGITIENGDLIICDRYRGAILTSPNGNCYRIKVTDDGVLETQSVNCDGSSSANSEKVKVEPPKPNSKANILEEDKAGLEETLNLQEEIGSLQNQIKSLRNELEQTLLAFSIETNSHVLVLKKEAILSQNLPNPFYGSTNIPYFIPSDIKKAEIRVTSINGKSLANLIIPERGKGQLILQADSYPVNTYYYSLFLDGKLFETKKMVLTK